MLSTEIRMEAHLLNKIHRMPSALAVTGLCRTSLYNALARGDFPEPVRIGRKAVGWRESDLAAWLESRPHRSILNK